MEPESAPAGQINGDGIERSALRELEPAAVEEFVRTTTGRVFGLLFRITGHREEAEDLTQDVYLRAFRALPRYRGESAPSTWIYRIALNVGRDAIGKRQKARERDGGEPDESLPASGDSPAETVIRREERTLLEQALNALPEDRRILLVMVDVEGMSLEEAGGALEIPEGTVKSRLHRSREALREEYRRLAGERRKEAAS